MFQSFLILLSSLLTGVIVISGVMLPVVISGMTQSIVVNFWCHTVHCCHFWCHIVHHCHFWCHIVSIIVISRCHIAHRCNFWCPHCPSLSFLVSHLPIVVISGVTLPIIVISGGHIAHRCNFWCYTIIQVNSVH